MKTEDIDKKIGMPDVDAEWAKFEREVIDKETPSHRNVMLWGLSIAASIALVAGIFLFEQGSDEQAETMVAEAEKPVVPSVSEADATVPVTEETPVIKEIPKTEQHSDAGLLAKATPSDTKKEETTSNHPATEESVKVFSSVEQSPGYPGGQKALQEFLKANKRYDGLAQEYGAKGRVITSFLVDSLGYISDIKVVKVMRMSYDSLRLSQETEEMQQLVKQQITAQLSEESKRLVSLMPRWMPGKMSGKSRNVRYMIPIQFP